VLGFRTHGLLLYNIRTSQVSQSTQSMDPCASRSYLALLTSYPVPLKQTGSYCLVFSCMDLDPGSWIGKE